MSNRFLARLVLAALVLAGLSFATPASAATTAPVWEPDANSADFGTLSFYDAAGTRVTSGNDLSHLFDYAIASTASKRATTKATLFFGFPDHTKADTITWYTAQSGAASTYPVANAPGDVAKAGSKPVLTVNTGTADLASALGGAALDQTDGYKDIVQLRLRDSGAGKPVQSGFWGADIKFDSAANTWTQLYPTVASNATQTSTALSASPASPSAVGTSVTFTATVSPAAAGTVQFKDGTTDLGSPQTVTSGSASVSTSGLATGTHSITAVFSPTDTAAYTGSTSAAASYVVTASPAVSTSTSLAVTPDSPADSGTTETLTATVTPADAAGTVTFKDGATTLGTPVAVTAGTASATAVLGAGSHSLTATFTPTDATAFAASTSTAVAYSVAQPPTATTTSIAANLASPQRADTDITFTATVAPATATGTVHFSSDGTEIGTDTVGNGSASVTVKTLSLGSHQITAAFVPAEAKKTAASTSNPITYVIAGSPSEPTGVTASAANTTATVTWTSPNDNGGTPITGYDVQYSTDGLNWVTGAPQSRTSTATSAVVTGLTNGVAYRFRVRAINGVPAGNSSYTATTTAVSPRADNTVVGVTAPATARYGTSIVVTGSATNARTRAALAGVRITLYRRVAGAGSYVYLGGATTGSTGTAGLRVTMTANSQFQWRFAATATQNAANSAVRQVTVPALVSISRTPSRLTHGTTAKVYGIATPAGSGQRVTLQQLVNRRWVSVASSAIARQKLPNGRVQVGYVFARKLAKKGTYTFRVYKAATSANTAVYSSSVSVRAT